MRRLLIPVTVVVLAVAVLVWDRTVLLWLGADGAKALQVVHWFAGSVLGLALAWLVVRIADLILWERVVPDRIGGPAPRLLRDVFAVLVFLVAIACITGIVYEQPVTGFLATSGAAGLVIGLAVRNTIADVLSGIAVNVEQPYAIGDWVELPSGVAGRVTEITWRSTRLLTRQEVEVSVPNGVMTTLEIGNYSRPTSVFRETLPVTLDYRVPVERARRVLAAGARSGQPPIQGYEPDARVVGCDDAGVKYEVIYWVASYPLREMIRTDVTTSVLRHLYQAGLTPAFPKQDLYLGRLATRQLDHASGRTAVIRRLSLFRPFGAEDVAVLRQRIREHVLERGGVVVREGEAGTSLYIVAEGLLEVRAKAEGGEVHVGRLEPGTFFGEMSLLTGAPRSATVLAATSAVVYEIAKEDIEPLMHARADQTEVLQRYLAERRRRTARAVELFVLDDVPEDTAPETVEVLDQVRRFFGSLVAAVRGER